MVDLIKCDICKRRINDGDEVLRGLKGVVIERPASLELHVDEEIWYHWSCIGQWIKRLEVIPELKDFNKLGEFKKEDGSIMQYYEKKKDKEEESQ